MQRLEQGVLAQTLSALTYEVFKVASKRGLPCKVACREVVEQTTQQRILRTRGAWPVDQRALLKLLRSGGCRDALGAEEHRWIGVERVEEQAA